MALQIKGKFVENAAIDGDKVELKVGQSLKQKKADGNLSELIKLDESITEGSKVRVDGQQVALKSEVDGLSTQVASQVQVLIAAESNARESADTALSAAITAGDASTLSAAKDYVELLLGVSDSDSISALANLQTWLTDNDEATGVITALAAVEARVDTAESDITALESDLAAEITRAQDAESGLQTAIEQEETDRIAAYNALQTAISTGDANTLSDANTYTDSQLVAATTTLNNEITSLQSRMATAEADINAVESALAQEVAARESADTALAADIAAETSARQAADADLDVRVDALEAVAHYKEKFVMPSTVPAFIELEREAKLNSIVASVGRLMIHQGEGEDFTVSVVAEKTRITFVGNLISPSPEQLGAGDVIYVKYMA